MKTVLITGANGFIARAVATAFARSDVRVAGVSRSGAPISGFDRVFRVQLGESMNPVFAEERLDAVVHCANDPGQGSYTINVEGTRRWIGEAQAHDVRIQVLMSSLSAREDALSDYGRSKWALEQSMREVGGTSLRLGLVVGNGGMFQKMVRALVRPVVPLLDGGHSRVYILGIDFVADATRRLVGGELPSAVGRLLYLQQPEPYRLVEVLRVARAAYGYRCVLVPVPSLPVLWALTLAERFSFLNLPITSTNVRGLRQSGGESFPSDFKELGGREESLAALVERAAAVKRTGG
jgi:nucleoside-diphosphate-sugar epimerase